MFAFGVTTLFTTSNPIKIRWQILPHSYFGKMSKSIEKTLVWKKSCLIVLMKELVRVDDVVQGQGFTTQISWRAK
jgi:hypothetical protein